jgi:hypothetical protein
MTGGIGRDRAIFKVRFSTRSVVWEDFSRDAHPLT